MHKTESIILISLLTIILTNNLPGQEVLFDFDNAPLYSSFPIDQTVNGITAHFSATGQGYSIQNADVLGFTPPGFAGHIIYPNSIYLSDILIRFDQVLTHFSIMYSCQELGCDDAATMRVTAYMNGSFIGTDTKTASNPGTWPVDTLSCTFQQGFDSVVVHYDSPPPTCHDYGVIYMADNMRVTPLNVKVIPEDELPDVFILRQNFPNPFNPSTRISYTIPGRANVSLKVFDLLGCDIADLVKGELEAGTYNIDFSAGNIPGGVYFYRLQVMTVSPTQPLGDEMVRHAVSFVQTKKMVLLK